MLCQAQPPAGTTITNQAETTFIKPSGETILRESNAVHVIVQPVEAFSLVEDRRLSRLPGASIAAHHLLTNTGNVESTYVFTLDNLAGNDFDIMRLALYLSLIHI